MASFPERLLRASLPDAHLYEEVEADTGALGQAMTVVIVAAVAGGIGSAGATDGHGPGLIGGAVASLVGWFVWAFTVYVVGTRLLPVPETKVDLGELLRTTGFAASPGIARVLGIIPGLGGVVMAATALWQLAAMVVAVRPIQRAHRAQRNHDDPVGAGGRCGGGADRNGGSDRAGDQRAGRAKGFAFPFHRTTAGNPLRGGHPAQAG